MCVHAPGDARWWEVARANLTRAKRRGAWADGLVLEARAGRSHVRRYQDFVDHKLYDLCLLGVAAAKENGRDVIQPYDLPITKGLQERVREFDRLDEEIDIAGILSALAQLPPLDAELSEEARLWLLRTVGGLSIAVAHCFLIVDPKLRNPSSAHWDSAFRLFDLLLRHHPGRRSRPGRTCGTDSGRVPGPDGRSRRCSARVA